MGRIKAFSHLLVSMLAALALLGTWSSAQAQSTSEAMTMRVSGVLSGTRHVRDMLVSGESLWILYDTALDRVDRKKLQLMRRYTAADGLPQAQLMRSMSRLSHSQLGDAVVVEYAAQRCSVADGGVNCVAATPALDAPHLSRLDTLVTAEGRRQRVTAQYAAAEGLWQGTADAGVYLDGVLLPLPSLVGPHVTALASFRDQLWYGTFNHGLGSVDADGTLLAQPSPSLMINALLATSTYLYVGSSAGLFRSQNGADFEQVEIVEDAVVGLTSDGVSVWATTPGALYRIAEGDGPPSDVWWTPGGAHSLQKVSASSDQVWIATEDRGTVLMHTTPQVRAKDKPFAVFDRSTGLASSWAIATSSQPDGSSWIMTLRDGALHLSSSGQLLESLEMVHPWGLSAAASSWGTWLGTQGGAYLLSATQPAHPLVQTGADGLELPRQPIALEGLPHACVHVIYEDPRPDFQGRMWFGTEGGLAWLDRPSGP